MFIPGDKKLVKERKSKFLKERENQGYESYCHRGHLIGVQFRSFIEYDDSDFAQRLQKYSEINLWRLSKQREQLCLESRVGWFVLRSKY